MRLSQHWITIFRERVGMSQNDLAAMLCTSRSNIAMNERSLRLLPNIPMLQLMQLMQLMDDPQIIAGVPPLTKTPEQAEKMRENLLYHAKTKRYEAEALLRKTKAYEQQQLQLQQTRVLIEAMTKHHEKYEPSERQVRWLALRTGRFSYNNFSEQEATENKMNQLRYTMLLKEAEEAERMAGEGR